MELLRAPRPVVPVPQRRRLCRRRHRARVDGRCSRHNQRHELLVRSAPARSIVRAVRRRLRARVRLPVRGDVGWGGAGVGDCVGPCGCGAVRWHGGSGCVHRRPRQKEDVPRAVLARDPPSGAAARHRRPGCGHPAGGHVPAVGDGAIPSLWSDVADLHRPHPARASLRQRLVVLVGGHGAVQWPRCGAGRRLLCADVGGIGAAGTAACHRVRSVQVEAAKADAPAPFAGHRPPM